MDNAYLAFYFIFIFGFKNKMDVDSNAGFGHSTGTEWTQIETFIYHMHVWGIYKCFKLKLHINNKQLLIIINFKHM